MKQSQGIGLVVLMAFLTSTSHVAAQEWNLIGNGNWNTVENWKNPATIPNTIDAAVLFGAVPVSPTTTLTVTPDIAAVVGNMTVNLTGITSGTTRGVSLDGANSLTFDVASGTATLSLPAGIPNNIRFNCPVVLNDDLTVNAANNNSQYAFNVNRNVWMNRVVSGAGGIIKTGAGRLHLDDYPNTFGGVTLQGGVLGLSKQRSLPGILKWQNTADAQLAPDDTAFANNIVFADTGSGTYLLGSSSSLAVSGTWSGTVNEKIRVTLPAIANTSIMTFSQDASALTVNSAFAISGARNIASTLLIDHPHALGANNQGTLNSYYSFSSTGQTIDARVLTKKALTINAPVLAVRNNTPQVATIARMTLGGAHTSGLSEWTGIVTMGEAGANTSTSTNEVVFQNAAGGISHFSGVIATGAGSNPYKVKIGSAIVSGNDGTGTVIFSGANTYTTSTAVRYGTFLLANNDTGTSATGAGDVTVAAGATIGNYNGLKGRLAGNLSLSAGAKLRFELGATTEVLRVGGTFTSVDALDFGNITVTTLVGFASEPYDLLTSTGTFGPVLGANTRQKIGPTTYELSQVGNTLRLSAMAPAETMIIVR